MADGIHLKSPLPRSTEKESERIGCLARRRKKRMVCGERRAETGREWMLLRIHSQINGQVHCKELYLCCNVGGSLRYLYGSRSLIPCHLAVQSVLLTAYSSAASRFFLGSAVCAQPATADLRMSGCGDQRSMFSVTSRSHPWHARHTEALPIQVGGQLTGGAAQIQARHQLISARYSACFLLQTPSCVGLAWDGPAFSVLLPFLVAL